MACVHRSFMRFHRGLKLPMDTFLLVCRCEMNKNLVITMPGLKQRLVVMFCALNSIPQKLSHSIKFSWGSMPPDLPSFCIHTNVSTQVQVPVARQMLCQAWQICNSLGASTLMWMSSKPWRKSSKRWKTSGLSSLKTYDGIWALLCFGIFWILSNIVFKR